MTHHYLAITDHYAEHNRRRLAAAADPAVRVACLAANVAYDAARSLARANAVAYDAAYAAAWSTVRANAVAYDVVWRAWVAAERVYGDLDDAQEASRETSPADDSTVVGA